MIQPSYVGNIANIGAIGLDNSQYALMSLISQEAQAYSMMHNPFLSTGLFRDNRESMALYEEAVRRGNGNIIGSVEITNHEVQDAKLMNRPADGFSWRPDMSVKTTSYTQHIRLGDFAKRKNFQIDDEIDQFNGLLNPLIARRLFTNMKTISTDLAPKSTYYIARKYESAMHYVMTIRDEANNVLVPFLSGYDIPTVDKSLTTNPSYVTHNFIINNSKRWIAGPSLDYNFASVSTVVDEGFINLCSQNLANYTDGRNTEFVANIGDYEDLAVSGKFKVKQSPYKLKSRTHYFAHGSAPDTYDGYIVARYAKDGSKLLSGVSGAKARWRVVWLEPVSQTVLGNGLPAVSTDWIAYISAGNVGGVDLTDKSCIAVGDVFEFQDRTKFRYRCSTAPADLPLQFIVSEHSAADYREEDIKTHFIYPVDLADRGMGKVFRVIITNPLRLPTKGINGKYSETIICDGEGKGNLWLDGLPLPPDLVPTATFHDHYAHFTLSESDYVFNSGIYDQSTSQSILKTSVIQALFFGSTDPKKISTMPQLVVLANDRVMGYTFRGDSVNHIPFLYDHLNPDANFDSIMMGRGRNSYERELVSFQDYQPLSLRMGYSPSPDWKYFNIKAICGMSTLAYRNNTNFIGFALSAEGIGLYQESFLGTVTNPPGTDGTDGGGTDGGTTLRTNKR